ncbi:MAG: hypothetical protein GF307_07860 [candidate division Zixibacteria bacterium]|nr:hypothetical protein [candidate division Zixibacteria bacterium]
MGWNSLDRVEELVITADNANQVIRELQNAREQEKDFIINGFKTAGNDSKNAAEKYNEVYSQLEEQLTTLSESEVLNSRERELAQGANQQSGEYRDGFETLTNARKQKDEAFSGWSKAGWDITSKIDQAFSEVIYPALDNAKVMEDTEAIKKWTNIAEKLHSDVIERFLLLRVTAVYLRVTEADEQWAGYNKQLNKTRDGLSSWTSLIRGIPALESAANNLDGYLRQYSGHGENYYSGVVSQRQAEKVMIAAAHKITENCAELREMLDERMSSVMAQSITLMITLTLAGIIIGSLLAFFITRGITKPINLIIENLTTGSEQVGSASSQVSSASQSLAEGASEQASSLEETSSALEEMSGMTKQNADNAAQANSLAKQANEAAENGNKAMSSLTKAIEEIKNSSDETAKIIKVIDEIAFQTNLLALNAAVEAARAGEAGKGFAVVAEEVRNLAMRSAEAAKNTSSLIEGSQGNAENGVRVAQEFNGILSDVVSNIRKVSELVNEVSAASNEQAQGITQINTAITQIDEVTQQNASNAEESASASEELSAQASELQRIVKELTVVINGANSSKSSSESRPGNIYNSDHHNKPGVQDRLSLKQRLNQMKKGAGSRQKKSVNTAFDSRQNSEEAIPLEEDQEELAQF